MAKAEPQLNGVYFTRYSAPLTSATELERVACQRRRNDEASRLFLARRRDRGCARVAVWSVRFCPNDDVGGAHCPKNGQPIRAKIGGIARETRESTEPGCSWRLRRCQRIITQLNRKASP